MLENNRGKQLKLRLEEMMSDSQKYDLLRAIYLLERIASYKTKNFDEKVESIFMLKALPR